MNKENKLGMGLGALLPTTNSKNKNNNSVQKINISQIIPNPSRPVVTTEMETKLCHYE